MNKNLTYTIVVLILIYIYCKNLTAGTTVYYIYYILYIVKTVYFNFYFNHINNMSTVALSAYSVPSQRHAEDERTGSGGEALTATTRISAALPPPQLPPYVQWCIRIDAFTFTPCGRVTILLILIPVAAGTLAFFCCITDALAPGVAVASLIYVLNCLPMLQPNFTKPGVFQDILFSMPNLDRLSRQLVGTLINWSSFYLLVWLLMWFFYAAEYVKTSTVFGDNTEFWMHMCWWSSCVAVVSENALGFAVLSFTMMEKLPMLWSAKVLDYVKQVRDILVLHNEEGEEEGKGDDVERGHRLRSVDGRIARLADAQRAIDEWARAVDAGATVFLSLTVLAHFACILLFIGFLASPGAPESRNAVLITMSIMGLFFLVGLLKLLYDLSLPNRAWESARIELLADAKVMHALTELGWSSDMWMAWLNNHSCRAITLFGTKLTAANVRAGSSAVASVFALATYLLLRSQFAGML